MKKTNKLNFNFVVVGVGLTGLCAAIAAARGGAKTARGTLCRLRIIIPNIYYCL